MSIAKHTGYNIAGKVAPLAVSLLTVPLYIHTIGLERYGILALCWLMLGYLGFLELGMGPSLQQRVAALKSGDVKERAELFWTALWINLTMGVVGGVVIYFFANLYFGMMGEVSPEVASEITRCIPWLALAFPVDLVNSVMVGAMKGRERFLEVNLVSSASSVAMTTFPLLVAILIGPRLDHLVAISLLARAAAAIIQFFQVRRFLPLGRPQGPQRESSKALISFGAWVSVTTILTPVLASADRLAIGAMLGAAAVSLYTIPYNLAGRSRIFSDSLGSSLFPRFASLTATERDSLERSATQVMLTLMTPLTLWAIVFFGPFLRLWIGPDIGARSEPVANIIIVGWWANSFMRVALARIQGGGRPDLITKLLLVELPFYFPLLYFGMQWWGIAGAALAWTIRAAADPIIMFTFTGQLKRLAPQLLIHGTLVLLAAGSATLMPYESIARWVILGLLAMTGTAIGIKTAPPQITRRVRHLADRALRLKKRFGS